MNAHIRTYTYTMYTYTEIRSNYLSITLFYHLDDLFKIWQVITVL